MWGLALAAVVAFLALRGSGGGAPSTPTKKCKFADKPAPWVDPSALQVASVGSPKGIVHLRCTDAATGDDLDVPAFAVAYTASSDTVTVQLQRAVGSYGVGDRIAVERSKIWSVE